jgi:hypothetical protein
MHSNTRFAVEFHGIHDKQFPALGHKARFPLSVAHMVILATCLVVYIALPVM